MPNPFFSIITCCYNSGQYIERNLDSVKNQTFSDFEHIIIDGLSKDNTMEIVRKYSDKADNIIIQESEPRGIANAMNLGIKKAQGEWLLFLNSDDYLNNCNVLKNVFNFINKKRANWYYGQFKYVGNFNRKEDIYPSRWYHRHFFYKLLLFINFIGHPATFLNKKLFNEYGLYREDIQGGMDYEYWLRIGKKEKPIFMPILVSNFCVGGFSTDPKNNEINKNETIRIRGMYTKFAAMTMWPAWIYRKIKNIK